MSKTRKRTKKDRVREFVPMGTVEGVFIGPMDKRGRLMGDEAEAWWRQQKFYFKPSGNGDGEGKVCHIRPERDAGGSLGSYTNVPREWPTGLTYEQATAIEKDICSGTLPIVALIRVVGTDCASTSFWREAGLPPEFMPDSLGHKERARREALEELLLDDSMPPEAQEKIKRELGYFKTVEKVDEDTGDVIEEEVEDEGNFDLANIG